MAKIWVLHRDEAQRAALARLAGAAANARVGSPADPAFDPGSERAADYARAGGGPRAVILGLGGELELELEFAHRTAHHLEPCTWILITEQHAPETLRTLFDSLDVRVLRAPVSASDLRRMIGEVVAPREATDPLSLRRRRDALSDRFARWFADLDLPELLRAMDPQLARVPLVLRGEPGTGRSLLARYVHTFGGDAAGGAAPFIEIACRRVDSEEQLLEPLVRSPRGRAASILLADLESLAPRLQASLRSWIEYGLPARATPAPKLRWIAALADLDSEPAVGLSPDLASAFAGIPIRVPPLRERRAAIAPLAQQTLLTWCRANGQRPRSLSPDALQALEAHAWPGNLRELEAVIVRALASYAADPLAAGHLRLDVDALELDVGMRELDDAPAATAPARGRVATLPEVELVAEDDDGGAIVELGLDELLPDSSPDDEVDGLPDDAFAQEHAAAGGVPLRDVEDVLAEAKPRADLPDLEALREVSPAEPDAERLRAAASQRDLGERERAWQQLVGVVAGELRSPLTSIRTFSELLADHHGDPEFRSRFEELVGADVRHIDGVIERLEVLARASEAHAEPVDVTELIETLLVEQRDAIGKRRLLVLKELDRRQPLALVSPLQLRFVLDGLLRMMLACVPDGGDIYIASRHAASGLGDGPSVRVLMRFARPQPSPASAAPADADTRRMEMSVAEASVRGMAGRFSCSDTATETVIVLDLPAPI